MNRYACLFGFESVVLQGFSLIARTAEGVIRGCLGGRPEAMAVFEARLVRALPLPADVRLFASPDGELRVAGADAAEPYLVGHMEGFR